MATILRRAPLLLYGGGALTLAFLVHSLVPFGGPAADVFFNKVGFNAVLLAGVAVIVARGLAVRRERAAWLLLGAGLALWTAANTYYSLVLIDLEVIPIPSVADALWLMFYPPVYLALVLLVRSRLTGLRRGMWLDGVIGALAMAALSAAVVVEISLDAGLTGSAAQIATTLAYPLGDLVLVGAITLVAALDGWRVERCWGLLGGGFLIFAVTDAIYFWQVAQGTYAAGGPVDVGWQVAALMFGGAAIVPASARRASRGDGQRVLWVPMVFGLLGLGLLVHGNVVGINVLGLALATLCVLTVIVRMGLSFVQTRQESLTDSLTGLPNRRRLVRDLRERAAAARRDRPLGLAIFDLNGFKGYNDRFGHPAGDALLTRLGARLAEALGADGVAYRMGGDEFCALIAPRVSSLDTTVSRAIAALREDGAGFSIDAAHGWVRIPDEEDDAQAAIRTADQRMYASKSARRASAEQQAGDALAQLLDECHPDVSDHSLGVSELAVATGRRLGLPEPDLRELALAARLHDVGKAAVPDAILTKPGPLDPDEWELMRRHPAAGERILRAAPALGGVARLVRSSHERVDGTGYPDGLAGEAIPLGARVVGVCDAFDAIVGDRPYAARRTPAQAAEELRRGAGTQFDARVVDAFLAVLAERGRTPAGIAEIGAEAPEARVVTRPAR